MKEPGAGATGRASADQISHKLRPVRRTGVYAGCGMGSAAAADKGPATSVSPAATHHAHAETSANGSIPRNRCASQMVVPHSIIVATAIVVPWDKRLDLSRFASAKEPKQTLPMTHQQAVRNRSQFSTTVSFPIIPDRTNTVGAPTAN